jgi:hypothetical protein
LGDLALDRCAEEFGAAASVQLEGLSVLEQMELLRFKRDVPLCGREQAWFDGRENQKQG